MILQQDISKIFSHHNIDIYLEEEKAQLIDKEMEERKIIDLFKGNLYITTFKKLPTIKPNKNINTSN